MDLPSVLLYLASLLVLLVTSSSVVFDQEPPCRASWGGEGDQLHLELKVDPLRSEVQFVFKIRKDVLGYYTKMLKCWLEGPHLDHFCLPPHLPAEGLSLTFRVSPVEFGQPWHSCPKGGERKKGLLISQVSGSVDRVYRMFLRGLGIFCKLCPGGCVLYLYYAAPPPTPPHPHFCLLSKHFYICP